MLVQVDIFQDEDGHWCAEGVGHGIVTQGDDLDELMGNIREACELQFEDLPLQRASTAIRSWREGHGQGRRIACPTTDASGLQTRPTGDASDN